MNAINRLLAAAETALLKTNLVGTNHQIKGTIVGYIAAFGAEVINMDLLPTLAVYRADKTKALVLDAIAKTLNPNDTEAAMFIRIKNHQTSSLAAKRTEKENIINASVALKLMARTFIIKDND